MSDQGLYYIMGGVQGGTAIKECVLALSKRYQESARVLYIGAAHGDKPSFENGFLKSLDDTGLELDVLHLHDDAYANRVSEVFQRADIVFFDGGDVSVLSEAFERFKLKDQCRKAFDRGASVGGLCAGGSYFASTVIHTEVDGDELYVDQGLGLIPNSTITCYIGDRAQMQRLSALENVSYQRGDVGVGVPINQVVTWNSDQGYSKLLDGMGPVVYTPD